jgi:hypothetical protein
MGGVREKRWDGGDGERAGAMRVRACWQLACRRHTQTLNPCGSGGWRASIVARAAASRSARLARARLAARGAACLHKVRRHAVLELESTQVGVDVLRVVVAKLRIPDGQRVEVERGRLDGHRLSTAGLLRLELLLLLRLLALPRGALPGHAHVGRVGHGRDAPPPRALLATKYRGGHESEKGREMICQERAERPGEVLRPRPRSVRHRRRAVARSRRERRWRCAGNALLSHAARHRPPTHTRRRAR